MSKFNYKGDIQIIIDFFKFIQVKEIDEVNKDYETFEKVITGYNDRQMMLLITIQHHPELEDVSTISLLSNVHGTGHEIRLAIDSTFDLNMFIKTISK